MILIFFLSRLFKFSSEPKLLLSRIVMKTFSPYFFCKASVRWLPRKPVPPVIKMFELSMSPASSILLPISVEPFLLISILFTLFLNIICEHPDILQGFLCQTKAHEKHSHESHLFQPNNQ